MWDSNGTGNGRNAIWSLLLAGGYLKGVDTMFVETGQAPEWFCHDFFGLMVNLGDR